MQLYISFYIDRLGKAAQTIEEAVAVIMDWMFNNFFI